MSILYIVYKVYILRRNSVSMSILYIVYKVYNYTLYTSIRCIKSQVYKVYILRRNSKFRCLFCLLCIKCIIIYMKKLLSSDWLIKGVYEPLVNALDIFESFLQGWKYGRSKDNVQSNWGFDRSNIRLAGHVDWSNSIILKYTKVSMLFTY